MKIERLRDELAGRGLDGFLIPRADKHQGEQVPPSENRLAWFTGFDGSAGVAVVLPRKVALFVDGRYELQAAEQTRDAGIDVVPLREVALADWLERRLSEDTRLGYDPWLHTAEETERLERAALAAGAHLIPAADNPVDAIWDDRPASTSAPAWAHPAHLTGEPAREKIDRLSKELRDAKLDAAVITLPDGVNWLLNIRGADIPNTPVALAFAVLDSMGRVTVFTDAGKIDPELAAALGPEVAVAPWASFTRALDGFAGRRVAVEKASAPAAVSAQLQAAGAEVVWRRDVTALPKARKTPAELAGARAAHRRDGAALAEILAWIDRAGAGGALTELEIAEALGRRRREVGERLGGRLLDESFSPIVGFGPNAAIVHYRVTPESSRRVSGDGLLLIDSGGHYVDGTTDVTRTIAIGSPSAEERAAATRVLQGMISISTLKFPPKTAGRDLDAFARRALWAAGLDYDHGTGHGVGSVLSVHEGPQSLSKRGSVALEPGMVLSNEPGCYKAGAFGVRLENLIAVNPPKAPESGAREMLSFETLTLAPLDRRLIDPALMSAEERAWVDAYHARVLLEIGPLLSEASTQSWLAAACAPL